jgi:hypothetical protein
MNRPNAEHLSIEDFSDVMPHALSIFKREKIDKQMFMRPDGTMICIGMSKQAQDVIGIQYESWNKMQKRIKDILTKSVYKGK